MNKEKLEWFETHIKEYLNTTIYDPDSLIVYLPEEKWFKVNPTRGIRQGKGCYDLTKYGNSIVASILKNAYGEFEYNRNTVDNKAYRFARRTVACGGSLYPNNIYVVVSKNGEVRTYQYNPALNLLHFLDSTTEDKNHLEDNCCYFVMTNYYWRNWLKYRYFGYRLMLVDTGYALANLCMVLSQHEMFYDIEISSKLFGTMSSVLGIDTKYESLCGVVSTKNEAILNSFDKLKDEKIEYQLFEDWDTVPINLYDVLEKKVENEQFHVHKTIDKLISECQLPYHKQNRVSPGGGAMITQRVMDGTNFKKSIDMLNSLQHEFKEFTEDIKIYVYINKMSDMETGLYTLEKGNMLKSERMPEHPEQLMNHMLRKKNFNLQATPVLFFIGTDVNKMIETYGVSGFKIAQIKTGFVSQLLTYSGCVHDCWTHPILGFDVEIAEQLVGAEEGMNMLNLVTFSDRKSFDRFASEFKVKELA